MVILNIYDKKGKVVKTYSTNEIFVTTGIVEDIFKYVDIDTLLNKSTSQEDLGKLILKIVVKGWSNFKEIILNLFDNLTEEEFRETRINEVASVILNVLTYALSSLNSIGTSEKN